MAILTVKNLTKIFVKKSFFRSEKFISVNDISFEIEKGEILGLLGPNGAGKTTTISMLLSTLVPTSGQIYYFGKDFFNNRSSILRNVGFATAYQKMPSELTVTQILKIFGLLYGLSKREIADKTDEYLHLFGISDLKDKQCMGLSAGETTRVMLAKAFLSDPKIVLLDEPTASLDPDIAHAIRKFILIQREKKDVSFLFTSHDMSEVAELCDRVLVLKGGQIIANNRPVELARQVRETKVNLLISDISGELQSGIEGLASFLNKHGLKFEKDGNYIAIEVLESKISWLLSEISKAGINYTEISINKPTLEDYFLSVAKR